MERILIWERLVQECHVAFPALSHKKRFYDTTALLNPYWSPEQYANEFVAFVEKFLAFQKERTASNDLRDIKFEEVYSLLDFVPVDWSTRILLNAQEKFPQPLILQREKNVLDEKEEEEDIDADLLDAVNGLLEVKINEVKQMLKSYLRKKK